MFNFSTTVKKGDLSKLANNPLAQITFLFTHGFVSGKKTTFEAKKKKSKVYWEKILINQELNFE